MATRPATSQDANDNVTKLLQAIIEWLQTVGVLLPDTTSKIAKVIGSLIFSGVDIISGGIALSWMFSQRTPPEFLGMAKLIAWGISIALHFVVRSLVDDGDGIWYSGPSLFGWLLNIADAFVDATTAFILFGLGNFLIEPGLGAFLHATKQMPLIGWFIWGLLFTISLVAEHWREAMKPGQQARQPAAPARPHRQPARPTPATVTERPAAGTPSTADPSWVVAHSQDGIGPTGVRLKNVHTEKVEVFTMASAFPTAPPVQQSFRPKPEEPTYHPVGTEQETPVEPPWR
jgi:hypothetical protein